VVIERGEIWWAELPNPQGSEPGYRRPVVVISSNDFNRSTIKTVLAVVITSNLRLAEAPGNVNLLLEDSRLSKDSVANVSQVITIDKDFFTERVGKLPVKIMRKIEDGLRFVMNL
jgi:mRNA interferase MazF